MNEPAVCLDRTRGEQRRVQVGDIARVLLVVRKRGKVAVKRGFRFRA